MIFLRRHKKYVLETVFDTQFKLNRLCFGYYVSSSFYRKIFECMGSYRTIIEFTGKFVLDEILVYKKSHLILHVWCGLDYNDDYLHEDIKPDDRPWIYNVEFGKKPPANLQQQHNNLVTSYRVSYKFVGKKITLQCD